MTTARWKQMVEKEQCGQKGRFFLFPDQAVKLLARQHEAMVRKVKKLDRYSQGTYIMLGNPDGEFILRRDLLAALATQGRKKK